MADQLQTLGVAGVAVGALGAGVAAGHVDGSVAAVCITIVAVASLLGRYGVQVAKTLKG